MRNTTPTKPRTSSEYRCENCDRVGNANEVDTPTSSLGYVICKDCRTSMLAEMVR